MENTTIISLREYDENETVWNTEDMIKYFVNKRDARVFSSYNPPKMTTPIPMWKQKCYGLWKSIEKCGLLA